MKVCDIHVELRRYRALSKHPLFDFDITGPYNFDGKFPIPRLSPAVYVLCPHVAIGFEHHKNDAPIWVIGMARKDSRTRVHSYFSRYYFIAAEDQTTRVTRVYESMKKKDASAYLITFNPATFPVRAVEALLLATHLGMTGLLPVLNNTF